MIKVFILYTLPLLVPDCGSTYVALQHGGVERNPLFHNTGGCVAAHVALGAALTAWDQSHNNASRYDDPQTLALEAKGRKKARVIVTVVEVLGGAYLASHNLRVR